MAESERMATIEERLSNLLRAFNEFRTEDASCFADFRQEQQESFGKLEAHLTLKLEEYSTRIRVLELWRSGLMGAWGYWCCSGAGCWHGSSLVKANRRGDPHHGHHDTTEGALRVQAPRL